MHVLLAYLLVGIMWATYENVTSTDQQVHNEPVSRVILTLGAVAMWFVLLLVSALSDHGRINRRLQQGSSKRRRRRARQKLRAY